MSERIESNCREYVEWMELNRGELKTTKHGKLIRFTLYDCEGFESGCYGCPEYDNCDVCNVKLCYYLAKCIDDEVLCPLCWVAGGCETDDRLKGDN